MRGLSLAYADFSLLSIAANPRRRSSSASLGLSSPKSPVSTSPARS
ncbi:hypothetical protein M2281_004926 [Mesorhizobium soli]|nr:hypothetical protein [Mesorhizobium soli]